MSWKSSLLALVLILASCKGKQEAPPVVETPEKAPGYHNPKALVEAADLAAREGSARLKIIDFRSREDFDRGHIPGALPMWRPDIEDQQQETPGLIAPRETVEALLSGLGISTGDTLVVYDAQGGVDAARLWWVMRVYGFDQAHLLNGGLQAWERLGLPLSTEYTTPAPGEFRFPEHGHPGLRIGKDSVLAVLGNPDWTVIDTRTTDEYTGKRQKEGAATAGRIPGSLHLDWANAVAYNGDKTFRPVEELKKIYARLPQDRNSPIIAYCHSGVRSAHTSFVLTQLLGYSQVHNYDGSWLEWSALEGTPKQKDSITSILK